MRARSSSAARGLLPLLLLLLCPCEPYLGIRASIIGTPWSTGRAGRALARNAARSCSIRRRTAGAVTKGAGNCPCTPLEPYPAAFADFLDQNAQALQEHARTLNNLFAIGYTGRQLKFNEHQ